MAQPKARRSRRKPAYVHQFLVVLPGTDPLVWRRILVPEAYTFWDLHVAIQDAMGWLDAHLHEFEIFDHGGRIERIGIPLDDLDDVRPTAAGWEVPIAQVLAHGMGPMRYRYDFGDDWAHTLEPEGVEAADGGRYPRCVAGAGACPPEDVGGTPWRSRSTARSRSCMPRDTPGLTAFVTSRDATCDERGEDLGRGALVTLSDADARARRREREAERRAELDRDHLRSFADRVRETFPGAPPGRELDIAEHACRKYGGRVGRSAAAKALDAEAVYLAVAADVRHHETDDDAPLASGMGRHEARERVAAGVDDVLWRWRAG